MKSHIRADLSCKVSFHSGKKYSISHNHRAYNQEQWNKDGHIDYKRSDLNEIIISKNLKDFFDDEFGDALVASDKANERKHPDRVWGISRKEYEKIKKEEGQERADEVRRESAVKGYYNAKKREVQEFIIQLGNHEDYLMMVEQYGQEKTDEFYREFLTDALKDFQEQNPQLVVFDASLHFDEVVEGSPHIHIDTLPVAESKQGLKKKVSLEGALKMQGYDRKKSHTFDDTPYKNFLRVYRAHLEELAGDYVNVIPSEHTGRKHTPTNVWRNQQLTAKNQKLESDNKNLEVERDKKVLELSSIEPQPQLPPPLPEDEPRPKREHRIYTREEEKELEQEQKEWDKRHAKPSVFNPKGGERYQAEQAHADLTEQRKKERDEWNQKNTPIISAKNQSARAASKERELAKREQQIELRELQAAQQIKAAKDAQFAALAQREAYALERVPLPTTAELFARNYHRDEQQQTQAAEKQQTQTKGVKQWQR